MNHYLDAWRNFFVFDGRATRTQYWSFFGIHLLILFVLSLTILEIYWAYSVAALIPTLAYGVRRLHDAGYSGLWILLPIVNFLLLLRGSTEGENRFGPPVV